MSSESNEMKETAVEERDLNHHDPAPGTKFAQLLFTILFCLLSIYLLPIAENSASWFTDMDHSYKTTTTRQMVAYFEEGRYPWEGFRFLLTGAAIAFHFGMVYASLFAVAFGICLALRRDVPAWAEALALSASVIIVVRSAAAQPLAWGGSVLSLGMDPILIVAGFVGLGTIVGIVVGSYRAVKKESQKGAL
jgi:hypothetical protein